MNYSATVLTSEEVSYLENITDDQLSLMEDINEKSECLLAERLLNIEEYEEVINLMKEECPPVIYETDLKTSTNLRELKHLIECFEIQDLFERSTDRIMFTRDFVGLLDCLVSGGDIYEFEFGH